jgi:hypothetical protein
MREAFACPYVVGYMRCQYIDRFADRRGAIKLGLLRDDGTPYVELAAATTRASAAIRREVFARSEIRKSKTARPPIEEAIRNRP